MFIVRRNIDVVHQGVIKESHRKQVSEYTPNGATTSPVEGCVSRECLAVAAPPAAPILTDIADEAIPVEQQIPTRETSIMNRDGRL